MPGLETTIPLLGLAVREGRLDARRFDELVTTGPQRVLGLEPPAETRTLVDLDASWVVDGGELRSATGWSPFDGMRVWGRVREVRIRGSMDRVEQDEHGRAYVVDFKTGKQAPTRDEVAHHPQLAVYQLAVREGAVDGVFDGRRPEPGGAELVQLRQPAPKKEGGEALPRVQAQEPLTGEWVGDLLATAAGRVLDERFTPSTGTHCEHCAFRSSCSARPEGRHIVE